MYIKSCSLWDPKKFYGTLQYAADIESDESDDPDLSGDDAEGGVHSKIQTNQNDPDSESDYSSDDDLPLSEIQRRISKNIEWHEEHLSRDTVYRSKKLAIMAKEYSDVENQRECPGKVENLITMETVDTVSDDLLLAMQMCTKPFLISDDSLMLDVTPLYLHTRPI
ncbi:unnamed protein product [Acanthoscelides obtectus]|uniref:Uncharacterized protein n=1 Tax=Acanthoscelides obtectus TaxID=200917 RepID=A0A9P0L2E9_ACAOB|nr:unnamed protein product [Acanthoscelides obtectus]CAK1677727.1 hypothetical protein AOBTE_LOCUS31516 [Acanthoscelides obtectus]